MIVGNCVCDIWGICSGRSIIIISKCRIRHTKILLPITSFFFLPFLKVLYFIYNNIVVCILYSHFLLGKRHFFDFHFPRLGGIVNFIKNFKFSNKISNQYLKLFSWLQHNSLREIIFSLAGCGFHSKQICFPHCR